MNKVTLIGRLARDPELRFTPGAGKAVATFPLAVDRRFKREGQQEADFFNIVVWGKQAENTANYVAKGRLIAVSGRLETRNYEAKDGTRRYVTEIIADEVQFLEWGNKEQGSGQQFQQSPSQQFQPSGGNDFYGGNQDFGTAQEVTPINDDDIPF